MGEKEQKLTIRADAKGFEDAAKKVAKVTEAQANLKDQTEELNAELGDDTLFERTKHLTIEFGKLAMALFGSFKAMKFILGGGASRAVGRTALSAKNLAIGFGKLTMAIMGSVRVLRFFSVGGAIMAAARANLGVLREEIALRERLVEITGLQSKAADELRNKELAQKATLEDMARRIRKGGFGSPDVARTVQQGAAQAKKQFTQLDEGSINAAFAAFGGIPGTSQRDLVDLAIIAHIKPGGLQVGEGRSTPSLQRQRDRLLRQFRGNGQIDEFARTETRQGDGTGRKEFLAGATERAQRALEELRTPGGSKATGMARLKELLPADFAKMLEGESSRLELAAELYEMFEDVKGFEGAKVGVANARPLTTLINQWRGWTEIGLTKQPGLWQQAVEGIGIRKDLLRMRSDDLEEMLRALRTIEKEGKRAADANERAAEAAERPADRPTVYNYQNAKFIGTDADARHRRTRNGVTLSRSREGV